MVVRTNPFERTYPEEPPISTVLAYQREGRSGVTLDYISFRANDGRWYTTGGGAKQGVSWSELWAMLRTLETSVWVAASWKMFVNIRRSDGEE